MGDNQFVKDHKVYLEVTVRTAHNAEMPSDSEVAESLSEALPKEMQWGTHEDDWGIVLVDVD